MSMEQAAQASGNPVIDHLDLWSSVYVKKAATGRGSNGKTSPYGIQKLRELILELAVQGKLVLQDPNDEPADVLLGRIAKDEARLVKEGLIRKPKKFPAIEDDEKSIQIPESWEWIRIRGIGHDWGQKKPDRDFSYIDVSAIDNHAGKVSAPSVLTPADAPSRARKIVAKGTVIYSTVRPYLKNIAVVEDKFDPEPIASTAFAILHPYAGIPAEYLVAFFRSPIFVRHVESVQTGIAYPAINDKQFYGAVFPLPPLAEQHRIVA
ncbi:MAG: restriction endonuclease subunit S, partial [Gammaproteobacteria bacterium]|nr:restriction endonuclease subunit S [Gammaproteobacteria bacterium]